MGINLGINPIPKFDSSLLPWLRQLVDRIQGGFNQVNKITVGTTAPDASTSVAGDFWLDTNFSPVRLNIYNGTAWIVPYPLGRLGFSSRTGNSAVFAGAVVYPNNVVVTLPANRKIRVTVDMVVQTSAAAAGISLGIANGAGTILTQSYEYVPVAGVAIQMRTVLETTSGTGGSTTYQVSAFTSGPNALLVHAATAIGYISVDDMGPS